MQGIRTLSSAVVSGIFVVLGPGAVAADSAVRGTLATSGVSETSAAALAASSGIPLAAAAPQQAKSYPGLMPLVSAHRAEQVKMVKLWQTIKSGNGDEKTAEKYKEAQERTAKASAKVSEYIEDEKWSVEDRLAMQKLWAAELEKPVE